jgi:hypothetical protein
VCEPHNSCRPAVPSIRGRYALNVVLPIRIAGHADMAPALFHNSEPVGGPLYHFFQDVRLADHSRLNKPDCFRYA